MTFIEAHLNFCNDLLECKPLIEAALAYSGGTHTYDDICHMVITGKLIFWRFDNSFLLMEVVEYPRKKCLHLFLGSGILDEIMPKQEEVCLLAQSLGCSSVTMSGRVGWKKVLTEHQWETYCTTFILDVASQLDRKDK